MKIKINKDGQLEISAKNYLENFALKKWCDDNFDINKITPDMIKVVYYEDKIAEI